jgi:hypothetical protein
MLVRFHVNDINQLAALGDDHLDVVTLGRDDQLALVGGDAVDAHAEQPGDEKRQDRGGDREPRSPADNHGRLLEKDRLVRVRRSRTGSGPGRASNCGCDSEWLQRDGNFGRRLVAVPGILGHHAFENRHNSLR